MNEYNFNHLYYFYITAKLEGITIAANHLNTSQSSLSVQIKNLEYSLKKKLFKKAGRRIELSDDGKELFQYCRRAFETFEEMSDHIRSTNHSMGARVSIGISNDIHRPFLTDIIGNVIKSYEKKKQPLVNLVSLSADSLIDLLKTNQLDLVVTTKVHLDGQLNLLKEFVLPVFCYGGRGLKKTFSNYTLDQLVKKVEVGFVMPAKPTLLRNETEALFVKKKAWPKITFESNMIDSVVRGTVDGLGLTMLPQAYVMREVSSERIYKMVDTVLWKHRLMAVTGKAGINEFKADFSKRLVTEFLKIIQTEISKQR